MKTVAEMLEEAKKYQAINPSIYSKSFDEIAKVLRPEEEVLCAFTGTTVVRKNNSMLWFPGFAITNQRLIIGGQIKGLLKVSYTSQTFKIDNINAISQSYSLVGADLIIDTLGDDLRIGEGTREAVNLLVPAIEETLHAIQSAKEPPQVSKISAADEIMKYKELLDMGVLTQAEFDAKKKELLGL